MTQNKIVTLGTILPFVIGILFGSGVFWKYMDHKVKVARTTIEIREKLDDMMYKIIELTAEYIDISTQYKENNDSKFYIKLKLQKQRLDFLKNDYRTVEAKLAQMENRQPRKINLDFTVPVAPSTFSVTITPGQ